MKNTTQTTGIVFHAAHPSTFKRGIALCGAREGASGSYRLGSASGVHFASDNAGAVTCKRCLAADAKSVARRAAKVARARAGYRIQVGASYTLIEIFQYKSDAVDQAEAQLRLAPKAYTLVASVVS